MDGGRDFGDLHIGICRYTEAGREGERVEGWKLQGRDDGEMEKKERVMWKGEPRGKGMASQIKMETGTETKREKAPQKELKRETATRLEGA